MRRSAVVIGSVTLAENFNVIAYLPLLLIAAIPMGSLTGGILAVLEKHMAHMRLE